jgi:hypothetical protein
VILCLLQRFAKTFFQSAPVILWNMGAALIVWAPNVLFLPDVKTLPPWLLACGPKRYYSRATGHEYSEPAPLRVMAAKITEIGHSAMKSDISDQSSENDP